MLVSVKITSWENGYSKLGVSNHNSGHTYYLSSFLASNSITMESAEFADRICNSISRVFSSPITRPSAMSILVEEIAAAVKRNGKVFLFSVGREGLMLRAFCMRLYHIGLDAHCILDMNTPPCRESDLLIASAGPGGHATVNVICEKGQMSGARVVLITSQPDSGSAVPFASIVAHLPARVNASELDTLERRTLLPMGSVYEAALFVLFEMVIYKLSDLLNISPKQICERLANLE